MPSWTAATRRPPRPPGWAGATRGGAPPTRPALPRCRVQRLVAQLDRGYTLPSPSAWVVRDNKWRATRYGLDAIVITDEAGATAPLRAALFGLLAALGPAASGPG